MIFGENVLNIKCVFFPLQLLSETLLILKRTEQNIINLHRSSRKELVILSNCSSNLNSPRHIFKKPSNIKFHENPSIVGRVFAKRAGGETDTAKLTVAFHSVAKRT